MKRIFWTVAFVVLGALAAPASAMPAPAELPEIVFHAPSHRARSAVKDADKPVRKLDLGDYDLPGEGARRSVEHRLGSLASAR